MARDQNQYRDVGLERRDLLKVGALGVAAVATGCATEPGARPDAADGVAASQADAPFEHEEATIASLGEQMARGSLTAVALTQAYLDRIAAVDGRLRSVLETNPEALEIAARLDREREEGQVRGPLHGMPILVKDNLDTADRMTTTAGSLALEGRTAAADSAVVRQLRQAGAIILGKTNLSEWANFRSTHSSSGWSGRGGQCGNPYALDRSPCGSSSGSGAATSANLCVAAIGSETDGSIVCPSSACGLAGIKPTLGLVSRSGIVPIAHSQDTAGPMARTLTDAAIVLGAITAADPTDEATNSRPGDLPADYQEFLDALGLAGARIGLLRQTYEDAPDVAAVMEEAVAALRDAGATVIDPVAVGGEEALSSAEFEVLLYEFKADLNEFLAAAGSDLTLEKLIAFNKENAAREMPYFGQEIFHLAQAKGGLGDRAYREALQTCRTLSRAEGIDKVMAAHELDAIVAPTGGPAWLIDLVNGDHFHVGSSSLAAISGYPNVTVPAGYVFGLPVGVSFFGRAWSEPKLLSLAFAFEQATQARRPPRLLATADLTATS